MNYRFRPLEDGGKLSAVKREIKKYRTPSKVVDRIGDFISPPEGAPTREEQVNQFLGKPKEKAFNFAESLVESGRIDGDQPDNIRHALAGTYTAQNVSNMITGGYNPNIITNIVGDAAGVAAANILGAGHEVKHLPSSLKEGYEKNGLRGVYDALRTTGEDVANNFVGSILGVLPGLKPGDAEEIITELSFAGILPDGMSDPDMNMYPKGNE